jgi:myo-inositol-1(or 4)-monophosphatase
MNILIRLNLTTMQKIEAADISALYAFCQELARSAGAIIIQGSKAILEQKGQQGHGVNEKKNAVDLVTEWDVRVEEFVKKEIKEKYPSFDLWVRLNSPTRY